MNMNKKYFAPLTEVLDLKIPNNMLAGTQHDLDFADAKGNSFDDNEDMYEDDFSGWEDWPSYSGAFD